MRLFVFNCLLLASVAVASPNGRHKRDLAFLKNFITSAIFGGSQIDIEPEPVPVSQEEIGYRLFQLPEYDDVIVAPKQPIVEEFVYPPAVEKVNLNAFGTILGTKSKDDTLLAVKEVNNLLSTGILYGGQNNVMKETVFPMFPSLNTPNYVVEENIKTAPVIKTRPVLTEVIEPRPVLTEVVETKPVLTEVLKTKPVLTEVVETKPVLTEVVETKPVLTEVVETRPAFTEVIRPVEEKVELILPFEPTYSYKKIQSYEPVMTYTTHNNPGVELVETIKTKTELPMSIMKSLDETIVLSANPNRFAPVQEVFQYPSPPVIDFSYPRVGANVYVQNSFREEVPLVQKVYQYQSPSFVDFSYPRVQANSYVPNSLLEDLTKESDVTNGFRLTSQSLRPSKDSPDRYNLRLTNTKPIIPRPNPLHPHKSLHPEEHISASKDKVNPPTMKVQGFNNSGEKGDFPHTLGEYIALVNNKSRNIPHGNMKQIKAVPLVGSKDNVSNAKTPINVYKLQSNPDKGKVVNGSDALTTNVKTNANQYVNGPAVNSGTAKKDTAQVKNVVYTNMVTAKPQSRIVVANTDVPKQPLRENVQTSIHKPTVDQPKNADGSSLNVNGNKHGVSASVKENNNIERGDIPDQ